ncbi:MAG: hypothetical protein IJP89_02095 [Synergistaceae bacterium]|nr:hypothetical protein [Synergistaceae bacterium]MBR0150134.1 hypothetical protein [Synergistaceae bacterium]
MNGKINVNVKLARGSYSVKGQQQCTALNVAIDILRLRILFHLVGVLNAVNYATNDRLNQYVICSWLEDLC